MTSCRAKAKAAGLMAAAALVCAVPAHAQAPLSTFDPDTMELAEPANPAREIEVKVDDLKAPNAESVGTLDQAHGGLPPTLWAGTKAMVVRKLVPMLPGTPSSLAARNLQRRLLLTAATAPEGAVAGDRPSLVDLRAERLAAMGDNDGVVQLSAMAPQVVEGSVMRRVKLDAQLLTGRTDAACAEFPKDGSQPRLAVLCNYLAGRTLEGNLGLDLLRERKEVDAGFVAAAEVLAGLPPIPADKIVVDDITPLHVAAFGAAKLPLPANGVAKASAPVAKAVAMSFATPFDTRLAAGERAEAAGVLSAEQLRKLYLEATFAPDELAAPLVKAEEAGLHGRALLFRAATDQPDPLIRAHFVAKALELGAAKGQLAGAARVFSPLLAQLQPDPALITVAPTFARAAIALGQADHAKWLELARTDPAAGGALVRLWPLSAVMAAEPGQAVDLQALSAWRDSLNGLPPELAARRSAVVLGTLAALGAKLPDVFWLDALSLPAQGPRPALFALVQSAALDARMGTTVLAALAMLGEQPLDSVDPISLTEAISALTVVGLGQDARKLAVEAMLANGI
ncbi:antifreeze protein [Magnetospirillum aberrantis]|uniref:Antifreeze protein n=1 Tax=Magnetospirillum aberrantis SpK TaxID=908842 RepID=A0A7C9V001_9PROT|nr:antifreeze protein [Magnetospirillum aberrantis]NFV80913.1 antifreeze protein [Magnetospirillum aberrantis SpK]